MTPKEICTGCQKPRVIVFKFEAEINGQQIKTRLCRACLKKQAQKKN